MKYIIAGLLLTFNVNAEDFTGPEWPVFVTVESVTSNDVVWTSNHMGNMITTNGSVAYSIPHQDPDVDLSLWCQLEPVPTGCYTYDGLKAVGEFKSVSAVVSGTYGGKVQLILDGEVAAEAVIGIAPVTIEGNLGGEDFREVEFREVEGTSYDHHLVFLNEVTFSDEFEEPEPAECK